MTTFGIGVLSAVGAYMIGPALIVSALSLVAFTETIRAAGALLAPRQLVTSLSVEMRSNHVRPCP